MALSRTFFDDDFMAPFLHHWPVAKAAGAQGDALRGIPLDVKEVRPRGPR